MNAALARLPEWLGHETQVGIAAGIPGVYRLRDEAERVVVKLKKRGINGVEVMHFRPDNYAVITTSTKEINAPLVQEMIDEAISKVGGAS